MAERLVFLIDPDPNLSEQISAILRAYGLRVERFTDGNEAMAHKDVPALIILCIDPKKLGWAVCNKIKKNPGFKGVPLVVTSAEATDKDFDDHKGLKNRAEEYLRKPFDLDVLVDKISPLLGGLDEPVLEDAVEIPLGELAIEGDEIVVEEPQAEEPQAGGGDPAEFFGDEHTGVVTTGEIITEFGGMEADADAAFAAISVGDEATVAAEAAPVSSAPAPAPAPKAPPAPKAAPAAPPKPAAGPPVAMATPGRDFSQPIDLGLDEVAEQVTESSRVSKLPGAEGEIARLREERDRLSRELEEAKARASSKSEGAFSREREFLNLREVINKKEKEVLDLKDAVDAKDRQLLDSKDKMRELDRARRDLDEKMLLVEKELVAAREKIEAFSRDKETQASREKGVKARLDEAQKKLEKAYAEVDEWKGKHAADVDAAMAAAANATSQAEADLGAAHEQFAREMSEMKEKLTADLTAKHAAEMARATDGAVEAVKKRHQAELAELAAAQERLVAGKEQAHSDAMDELRTRHTDALANADAKLREELKKREAEHRTALERALADASAAAQAEAERAVRESEATVEALTSRHAQELAEQREAQAGELAKVREELAQALAKVERIEGLERESRKRIVELETTLQAVNAHGDEMTAQLSGAELEIKDRERTMGELRKQMTELEAESTKLQEQVLHAYQKMRNDETIVARARKALAIALTLLDEGAAEEERKSS
jgi:DNA-binding response OmpR family regulator/chromosome segregation ATPase